MKKLVNNKQHWYCHAINSVNFAYTTLLPEFPIPNSWLGSLHSLRSILCFLGLKKNFILLQHMNTHMVPQHDCLELLDPPHRPLVLIKLLTAVVGWCPLLESAGNGMSCIFCQCISYNWQTRNKETMEGMGCRLRDFVAHWCLQTWWLFLFHLICTNSGLDPSLPQSRFSSWFPADLKNAVSLFG